MKAAKTERLPVVIRDEDVELAGDLVLPRQPIGIVLFAHGSGSSRHSPRNQAVAAALHRRDIGTLLFDLLTEAEEEEEFYTRHLRFDISLLARRLVAATRWVGENQPGFSLGYFGSSTGAAAALVAAAELGDRICAVVSRGGRPDLAGAALPRVQAPTLLIVGGQDGSVIELNEQARKQMRCECKIEIVPGATHLFGEAGALEEVSRRADEWLVRHFAAAQAVVL